ncbi:transposable element Tcb1 transposase [Trichonephila clavipes]|nr:transposable element Tcb1 transposase [Trichonephila clavipes]
MWPYPAGSIRETRNRPGVISRLWQRFQDDVTTKSTPLNDTVTVVLDALVWGGIILGSRTDLHVQSVTMTGHIYRDVILEQHIRLFRGAMGAEFLFMDDNVRPPHADDYRRMPSIGEYHRMDCSILPDLNPIQHV